MSATIHHLPRKPPDLKSTANAMLVAPMSESADPEAAFYAGLNALRSAAPDINFVLVERVISSYGRLCLKLGREPGAAA
jgi:hypothetical protein